MPPKNEVVFGWGAPPLQEQHPALSEHIAEQFDTDNKNISRLRVRGLISDSELRAIHRRLVKNIEKEIRKALGK